MNNTIRTLQSIIDRNTNEIRVEEANLAFGKYVSMFNKPSDHVKKNIKKNKDFIKRKANEQRVLKKLIADEIEIANFNRNYDCDSFK